MLGVYYYCKIGGILGVLALSDIYLHATPRLFRFTARGSAGSDVNTIHALKGRIDSAISRHTPCSDKIHSFH